MSTISAPLAPDAAIALGIASTAMPFARTSEAMLERWLRVLRLYGDAGVALQALGVGEDRLLSERSEPSEPAEPQPGAGGADQRPPSGEDAVELVGEQASEIARELGGGLITTKHILLALMRVYGKQFDRVLQAHGCDRAELTQRLGVGLPAR
jgi:Clp amino terminal domain, pathogenicity island component